MGRVLMNYLNHLLFTTDSFLILYIYFNILVQLYTTNQIDLYNISRPKWIPFLFLFYIGAST